MTRTTKTLIDNLSDNDIVAIFKLKGGSFCGLAAETAIMPTAQLIPWLRALISAKSENYTHKCIRCSYDYTPSEWDSEDCPLCGCDGYDGTM